MGKTKQDGTAVVNMGCEYDNNTELEEGRMGDVVDVGFKG